jgi:hypothetical protein
MPRQLLSAGAHKRRKSPRNKKPTQAFNPPQWRHRDDADKRRHAAEARKKRSERKPAKKSPALKKSPKPARKKSPKPAAKRSPRKSAKKSGEKMQHNEFYSMHEKRRVKSNRFWVEKIKTKAGARYQAIAFDPQDRKMHKFVSKVFYDKHKGRKRM